MNPDPKLVAEALPLRTPDWGLEADPKTQKAPEDSIRATWLGHACFLVEFPNHGTTKTEGNRGVRILFDPVFSDRCSPVGFMGPKRYTSESFNRNLFMKFELTYIERTSVQARGPAGDRCYRHFCKFTDRFSVP
jgi:hypothetical protein